MKIELLHCGINRRFFEPQLKAKFGFQDYNPRTDKNKPLVSFSAQHQRTRRLLMEHKGMIVILWTGADTLNLHTDQSFVWFLKDNQERVFHIAYSHWLRHDLQLFGLKPIKRLVIPSLTDQFKFKPWHDNKIFHYTSNKNPWFYGTDHVKEIMRRMHPDPDNPELAIYNHRSRPFGNMAVESKKAFIGIRLTEHDGIAASVIEMGLMGRKTIFNGEYPCAINYSSKPYAWCPELKKKRVFDYSWTVKHVESLLDIYGVSEPDRLLAEEMRVFIHDDHTWLSTKFYS